jgi:penicillin-binding protein 1C
VRRAAALNAPFGHIAYKTGTSYGYRDAFAIGFDKAHTIAVWLGRPDNGSVFGLAGCQAAAPVLFDAFARLGTGHEFLAAPAGILASRTRLASPALAAFAQGRAQDSGGGSDRAIKNRFSAGWRPRRSRPDLAPAARATAPRPPRLESRRRSFAAAMDRQRHAGGGTGLAPASGLDTRRRGLCAVSVMDARGATDSVLVRLE